MKKLTQPESRLETDVSWRLRPENDEHVVALRHKRHFWGLVAAKSKQKKYISISIQ